MKRWLIAIILTIIAVAGGKVAATIMLSFWMGGGPIASFETPGGIITGLIESFAEIAVLEFLFSKFGEPRTREIATTVVAVIYSLMCLAGSTAAICSSTMANPSQWPDSGGWP